MGPKANKSRSDFTLFAIGISDFTLFLTNGLVQPILIIWLSPFLLFSG